MNVEVELFCEKGTGAYCCHVPSLLCTHILCFHCMLQNGAIADIGKSAIKQTQKPQAGGLFSDDEDAQVRVSSLRKIYSDRCMFRLLYIRVCFPQVFSSTSKSQTKPEPTSQTKNSKAPLSLFDDEEEEVGENMSCT